MIPFKPRENLRHRIDAGFTLLEITMVILIIAILSTMLIPAINGLREKAERANCASNLRNLHVAAQAFVQDNKSWPQIAYPAGHPEKYGSDWINALSPYGLTQKSWVCPTIQRQLGNPDYRNPQNTRVDYLATPFDSKPNTPFRWARQPWFIERGNVHGTGNLVIFPDGSIADLTSLGIH